MFTAAKNSQIAPTNRVQFTPIIRSVRANSTLTEDIGAPRNGLPTGHIMIGLIQHAAAQPEATPETRALAQRLAQRHLKPVARDV